MTKIQREELFSFGKITRTHGLKGGLKLKPLSNIELNLKKETVYIESDGNLVPFLLSSCYPDRKGFYIMLISGVNTIEETQRFINCEVLVSKKLVDHNEVMQFTSEELEGFEVLDSIHGVIGTVDYISLGKQPMMFVLDGENEILIPFHRDLITEINEETSVIKVNLPEGLLEVNL